MIIESVFESQHPIPSKYTGDGADISPPLKFLQLPSSAKSLALIVDDPDAPRGTFDHWIVWNIPPRLEELSEGAPELRVSVESKQGINGFGQSIYRGPAPPPGKPHRYFFKLYALDQELSIPEGSKKTDVEEAMKGHIIERAELIGTYQR
ncbi:PEBP family protein [Candidatus Protochlamydia naegleriophila]|uniref:PEBP family protein n=1 Tax=Candidatus Protochlamydia naegleriophila TaxID=389348 RepID=A0A0U5JFE7_9BACT|nr:YbhB/YbcL family Raf kinase inhibitor-like protein [Candidatus Protochlamydia naegleriophila]CUI16470.1 PEBP family protein [Candidatus Protochlamydia naegleriophila]